jgi:hypothetical protein
MESKATIYLAMPAGGHVEFRAAKSFFTSSSRYKVCPVAICISALASCFNRLWCEALAGSNRGQFSHFAMLHSDIEAAPGWIDVLMDEMNKHELGMIAAVSPIKSEHGITSTAVGDVDDIWSQRRLTMKEIYNLPETFTDGDLYEWKKAAGRLEHRLLLNTGCWLADLSLPQWRHVDEETHEMRFRFTQKDRIVERDGKFCTDFAPEDWLWSRDCHKAGIKIAATRKVKLSHYGVTAFSNEEPWGLWDKDQFD